MTDEEIEKLLEKNRRKRRDYLFGGTIQEMYENADRLVKIALRQIDEGEIGRPPYNFDLLADTIFDLKLGRGSAGRVFLDIKEALDRKLRKQKRTSSIELAEELADDLEYKIRVLESTARGYFRIAFRKELKDLDLPKKISVLEEALRDTPSKLFPYEGQAMEELIEEFEAKLNDQIKETNSRSKIGSEVESKKSSAEEKLKRTFGATFDQTLRFFYFLFDYQNVKAKAGERNQILSDLTGFSPNTIKAFFNDPDKKARKNFVEYQKDIEFAKNTFTKLQMHDVVRLIDNYLAEIEVTPHE